MGRKAEAGIHVTEGEPRVHGAPPSKTRTRALWKKGLMALAPVRRIRNAVIKDLGYANYTSHILLRLKTLQN